MRCLFISPCVEEKYYGGVQLTARLALEGLTRTRGSGELRVLCYGTRCIRSSGPGNPSDPGNQYCSHSKTGAVSDALKVRGWPQQLIFWHLDMVKLLPFLGDGARRKYLFLHGIECWRPLEGVTRRFVDRIDMFLTNSEFTWNRFTEINPRWKNAPHRTVRLGVGIAERLVIPPGPIPAAVIIGRMNAAEDYKGHRELIGAWPLVLKSLPDAELWIVGAGGMRRAISRVWLPREPPPGRSGSSVLFPKRKSKTYCDSRAVWCFPAVVRDSGWYTWRPCVSAALAFRVFTTPGRKSLAPRNRGSPWNPATSMLWLEPL